VFEDPEVIGWLVTCVEIVVSVLMRRWKRMENVLIVVMVNM